MYASNRYLAVTQPLNYSRRRRSKRLAMLMILIVWILALAITCPPILGKIEFEYFCKFELINFPSAHLCAFHCVISLLGWYEPGRRDLRECRYNENKGYVVFSAMGMCHAERIIHKRHFVKLSLPKLFLIFSVFDFLGSFFLPMLVMVYVYLRISCVVANRHDDMVQIKVHQVRIATHLI